jgi:IS30 family transposase
MANQLNMATINTIFNLHQQGWSIRRIGKTLGIHRDTVARHLREANQAGALTGSGLVAESQLWASSLFRRQTGDGVPHEKWTQG